MHPDEDSEPGPSTGPRTPAGKAVSSMNRLTHGCRSEKVILRHEDPAEYTAIIEDWYHQYNPQTPAERLLVNETAHAQWFLLRNQRRFDEVEYEKNMNFRNWTEDQNHEYALALRYKTAAERAFLRWFKELESYYARVERKQRQDRPALAPSPAPARKPPHNPPPPFPAKDVPAMCPNLDSPVGHESFP
ncbi:MAG TPA: hypothetical protein VK604_25225 [Bryobacteraceae bacterium]|nr:hypothetical protein [Bryobacteraceae bacterium]